MLKPHLVFEGHFSENVKYIRKALSVKSAAWRHSGLIVTVNRPGGLAA